MKVDSASATHADSGLTGKGSSDARGMACDRARLHDTLRPVHDVGVGRHSAREHQVCQVLHADNTVTLQYE